MGVLGWGFGDLLRGNNSLMATKRRGDERE